MEEIKAKFEESNGQRAWFVSGGYVDADTPEGFVYADFTTDMCWTCFFEAYTSQDKVIKGVKAPYSTHKRQGIVFWIGEN